VDIIGNPRTSCLCVLTLPPQPICIYYMRYGTAETTSRILDELMSARTPRVSRGCTCSLARLAALALTLIGPGFIVPAAAQTMGEYGGVTANSAAAASSMPKIAAPDLGNQNNSVRSNPSSLNHTEEIRTYEVPSTARLNGDDRNTDTGDSRGDWEQIK
jgi:hypothetical protein